ncbi:MAG: class I tRNA ligase family protein, partial [Oscillospiraceae bacterium]
MPQDYNKTLNLPQTDFPMRGNLPQREPETLKAWDESRLYYEMIKKNQGKPKYILHDGPPYANGDIHLGTALNKVLKDIIVKYKNMCGCCSPYIPGWDTHGLPIELKAMKKIGVENGAIPPSELRKHCREFALSYVENQKEQFKRLGVLGDFDDPYLTLKPEFEAKQVKVFGEMAKKGYIYKGLKPVYWCPECQTALAEAEIEYSDDDCHSIFVKFNVTNDKGIFRELGISLEKTFFVIWTTTTWTLPGNLAICLGPEYEYCIVKANGENYCVARELANATMQAAKISEYEIVGSFTGKELEGIITAHPFMERSSPIIIGDHVTLESGTGCVHTAPGHGVEDFEVCKNYPDIPIVVPVDGKGVLTSEAGRFAGLPTNEANKAIAVHLEKTGALFALEKIQHQYPHCWRCKSPILFRATEQWFCSINGFKDEAIKAIEEVKWIPSWGEE